MPQNSTRQQLLVINHTAQRTTNFVKWQHPDVWSMLVYLSSPFLYPDSKQLPGNTQNPHNLQMSSCLRTSASWAFWLEDAPEQAAGKRYSHLYPAWRQRRRRRRMENFPIRVWRHRVRVYDVGVVWKVDGEKFTPPRTRTRAASGRTRSERMEVTCRHTHTLKSSEGEWSVFTRWKLDWRCVGGSGQLRLFGNVWIDTARCSHHLFHGQVCEWCYDEGPPWKNGNVDSECRARLLGSI